MTQRVDYCLKTLALLFMLNLAFGGKLVKRASKFDGLAPNFDSFQSLGFDPLAASQGGIPVAGGNGFATAQKTVILL